jgi:sulfur carrier protein ThiS
MTLHIRFYDDLNIFLPQVYRYREITFQSFQLSTIQEVIESLNVPLSVVDLILVNGESVPVNYNVKENDRINVYPFFEEIEIGRETSHSEEIRNPAKSARFLAG